MDLTETLDREQPADQPCKTPSPDPATTPNCIRPADHKISAAAARESHAAPVDGTWITWLDQN